MKRSKMILSVLILVMIALLLSGCGGGNLVTPPIDDELEYVETITDQEGIGTFTVNDGQLSIEVLDTDTEETIENIECFLSTDGTDAVILLVDPDGEYIPRLISCQNESSNKGQLWYGIKQFYMDLKIKFIEGGSHLVYLDEYLPEGLTREILDQQYKHTITTELKNLGGVFRGSINAWIDFGIGFIETQVVTLILTPISGVGGGLYAIESDVRTIDEALESAMISKIADTYENLGYEPDQKFEIWEAKWPSADFGLFLVLPCDIPISSIPPIAYIDSIDPNPAQQGETVTFNGHGTDPDGEIMLYKWESNIDGLLNNLESFSRSDLSVGTHTISLKVFDTGANPSEVVSESLTVNAITPTPETILSPVVGDLRMVSSIEQCSNTKWCFNQHKSGGHCQGGGICQADDTYAWDANLNNPNYDSDNGKPVYAVEQGIVSQTYGGCINAGGSRGQLLIEHTYQGNSWWSGYLHLKDIQVATGQSVDKDTLVGYISSTGTDNNHLHFVVYTGQNSQSGFISFDTEITSRDFPQTNYTITAFAGPNGSISPSGDVPVNEGSDQTFTITPDTDYKIGDVLVDGSSVGAVSSYTFTDVTQNHTIMATFIKEDQYYNTNAHSAHFADGYWVELMINDPNETVQSVTVSGPGIDGSITLVKGVHPFYPNQWWSNPNVSLGDNPQDLPLVYTFTIIDKIGITCNINDSVQSYVVNFATNLLPEGIQTNGDSLVFSWIGVELEGVKYKVELSDKNWNRIWDSPLIADTSFTYNGPLLALGDYQYFVCVWDEYGNSSLADQNFQIKAPLTELVHGGTAIPWTDNPNSGINHLINVFWNVYEGADGYRVYRQVDNSNDWQLVFQGDGEIPGEYGEMTEKRQWHDEDVSPGNTYEYSVAAYGNGWETEPKFVTGPLSQFLPPIYLDSPADQSAVTNSTPTLQWSPLGGIPNGFNGPGKTELELYDVDTHELIWNVWFDDITTSSITFNQDGQATSSLVLGHTYGWKIRNYAYDQNMEDVITQSEYREFVYTLVEYPIIHYFMVDASSITEGDSAILSWGADLATHVTISPSIGSVGLSGSVTIYPSATTTYTLTATNSTGSCTATVIVSVISSSDTSATINSYSPSSKITVNTGQSFTINTSFTNTGTTAAYFYPGVSIWNSNGSLIFTDWGGKTYLNKDQQGSASWSHTINTPGEYWLQFGVWNEAKSELLDKKPSPSQNLIKVDSITQLAPQVTGVDPSQPTANPLRQYITILGDNFVGSAQVTLQIISSVYPIPEDRTQFIDLTRIKVYVGLTDSGNWKVWITNPDGQKSNEYIFYVKP